MSTNLEQWNEVSQLTTQITTQELDQMAARYQAKYEEYEKAKTVSTNLYKEAEELEGKLVEALQMAGKEKYFVEGIGTFYFVDKMSVKVPKTIEDKKKLFTYIRETHGETFYLDKISVNSQTLQKLYNEDAKAAAERGEVVFHIPGLEQPTNMRSLGLKKEKK